MKPRGGCGFDEDGFEIIPDVLSEAECDRLARELSTLYDEERAATARRVGGVRNLLRTSSAVAKVAGCPALKTILRARRIRDGFPVRALFFDKNPQANWRVPWHQDQAIAVVERIETEGFNGWSVKDGVTHVQPPREILENMAAIRLHLDDCNSSNGALKVIPGSHRGGRLDPNEIEACLAKSIICEISKGAALLMRPLLLHSSSPATNPSHRRVLHIEYATAELPNGLKWSRS